MPSAPAVRVAPRSSAMKVHCWRGGSIADVAEAVESPVRLASDQASCQRLLALIRSVPTPVWGRDELGAGEMWNSNSVTSWALASCGLDALDIRPPRGGRAPDGAWASLSPAGNGSRSARHSMLERRECDFPPGLVVGPAQSQPRSLAVRVASVRLRVPVLPIALDR